MDDKLDILFQQWNKFDSKVLVAETKTTEEISVENLIAESTKYCRYSGRLTWILIDWLVRNIEKLDIEKVLQLTMFNGDLTVLGLVSDLAKQKRDVENFDAILKVSRPSSNKEIFFYRVSKSKLATKLTIEQNLPIYEKWNFYCNEIRYLTTDNELHNKKSA